MPLRLGGEILDLGHGELDAELVGAVSAHRVKVIGVPPPRNPNCVRCGRPKEPYSSPTSYCAACRKAYRQGWRIKNLDAVAQAQRKHRRTTTAQATRARRLEARRERRRTDETFHAKEKRAESHYRIKQLYGITLADFDRMLAEQDGVCAICLEPETSARLTRLAIDHDHKSGRLRALLCSRCNRGLGYFKESPQLLWRALHYLRGHGKPWR